MTLRKAGQMGKAGYKGRQEQGVYANERPALFNFTRMNENVDKELEGRSLPGGPREGRVHRLKV
jgi:hypothetical protein